LNRKERRALKSPKKIRDFYGDVVAELRLAAKESRDPDPDNVRGPDAADHIRFINKERLPGGEMFGTYLLGIANAMERLGNGEAFTAEQLGTIMHTNPS